MYIKELKVNNFRGIKELKCTFDKKINCLIGASDSTKTTILDSIQYSLYPSWNLNITNTDFYNCDPNNTISIVITVGNIPEYLLNEERFGLYIRKLVENESENDTPSSEDEIFLTIKFTVNELFEPEWKVVTNRGFEKSINYKERSMLSVSRIGENIDKDFFIGRNSILKNYFADTTELNTQIFNILQNVKQEEINTDGVKNAFSDIKKVLDSYNVKLSNSLNLELEMKSSDLNISNVAISDGIIPLNKKGTGTKRLLSSILNLEGNEIESCILIDEIEYGLEPYRIADLLYKLNTKERQSIITTHSQIPITELKCNNIKICRSDNGITTCKSIPDSFQDLLRKFPYAFLSRKILVVEGATEWGILRTFNEKWSKDNFSFAYSSGIVVDGKGGISTIKYAEEFQELGYEVSIFIDGDDVVANEKAKKLNNIKVFKLEDNYNTEKILLHEMHVTNYYRIVDILCKIKTDEYVNSLLTEKFHSSNIDELVKIEKETLSNGLYEIMIKEKDGKPVFKNTRYGILLGELIIDLSLTDLKSSKLVALITDIGKWCNGN